MSQPRPPHSVPPNTPSPSDKPGAPHGAANLPPNLPPVPAEDDDPEERTQPRPPLAETAPLPAPVAAPPAPQRTPPSDAVAPWVIELRLVGTTRTLQLQVRETMTVGRNTQLSQGADVDLAPFEGARKGVSRQHALLSAKRRFLTIRDVGSTNGTRLNGFALLPQQDFPLEHGDEITFGDLRVQVRFAVMSPRDLADTLPVERPALPQNGAGRQVLVVEDDENVALAYRMALEHAGYVVRVAETLDGMAQAVRAQPPDAVLLDLILHEDQGLDVVRLAREALGPKAVLLVVSGMTGGYQVQQALDAGAQAFLGKPVRLDALLDRLHRLLYAASAAHNGAATAR